LGGTPNDYRILVAGVDGSPGSYVSPDPEPVVIVDEDEELVDEGESDDDVGSGETEEPLKAVWIPGVRGIGQPVGIPSI
jgi:hypothetical protein